MIARHWKGIVEKGKADEYISHLKKETLETIKHIKGFVKASILSRDANSGIEFLIITEWKDIDAIKQFAGEDYEQAVVPLIAQAMMVSYDQIVNHYEIHE